MDTHGRFIDGSDDVAGQEGGGWPTSHVGVNLKRLQKNHVQSTDDYDSSFLLLSARSPPFIDILHLESKNPQTRARRRGYLDSPPEAAEQSLVRLAPNLITPPSLVPPFNQGRNIPSLGWIKRGNQNRSSTDKVDRGWSGRSIVRGATTEQLDLMVKSHRNLLCFPTGRGFFFAKACPRGAHVWFPTGKSRVFFFFPPKKSTVRGSPRVS